MLKKKTGFLNFIQDRPEGSSMTIKALPIFVSLNKYTLSLFRSFKPSSLFKVINLDSIQRVDIQYKGTFCFDIIINEIHKGRLTTGPLSLCAKNVYKMKRMVKCYT